MSFSDRLDAMRQDFPACRSATFADIRSGLVLFASAERRLPQERLDAICEKARRLLTGELSTGVQPLLGASPAEAIARDGDTLYVFVRSPVEPDEALLCDCAEGLDIEAFVARAASELAQMGAAQ